MRGPLVLNQIYFCIVPIEQRPLNTPENNISNSTKNLQRLNPEQDKSTNNIINIPPETFSLKKY